MAKLEIIKFGDPILRQKAKLVTVFHKKFQSTVDSIAETLKTKEEGAALAATQVSILKRITVIDYEDEYMELINPEIIEASGEESEYEGCLSFPGYIGLVPRNTFIKVKFVTRFGKEKIIERSGNMARCIQHEIDHLDGILFIDRMKSDFLLHQETETKITLQAVLDLADGKIKNMDEVFYM